jgi:hypothetical protein
MRDGRDGRKIDRIAVVVRWMGRAELGLFIRAIRSSVVRLLAVQGPAMNSTFADFVGKACEATQPALGLRLPNLLAHLQRQREELQRAALELTSPVAMTAPLGEPGHEHPEVDHCRS